MSTQEKLRRAMMTGPNRWAEATINGKLVSYYEIHDETILLDLIESAKREGAIEVLKEALRAGNGDTWDTQMANTCGFVASKLTQLQEQSGEQDG